MDEKFDGTPEERAKRSPLYDATRKVMLAAIGAAAIAQEELEGFLSRLAERGELAERDARKLANEMKERRDEIVEEHRADRATRAASHRVATKEEVETLSARIAELNRQLDELKKSQGDANSL